jgi:phospholipid/cholesterol/gamma-HCH transport system substrate-binding protein
MDTHAGFTRIHPAWWTTALIVAIATFMWLCSALFAGTLTAAVPVMLTADRAGLVMESGAKVKLRGVPVGRVAGVEPGSNPVRLTLELYPDQIKHIPANTGAQIRATTIFGAKYVDLIYPEHASAQHISAGAVLVSRNVSTEVNTVFQNLVDVLDKIEPAKLNAVLSAMVDAVGGRGERLGEATTAASHVLGEINPRMPTVQADWRSLKDAPTPTALPPRTFWPPSTGSPPPAPRSLLTPQIWMRCCSTRSGSPKPESTYWSPTRTI